MGTELQYAFGIGLLDLAEIREVSVLRLNKKSKAEKYMWVLKVYT